MKHSSNLAIESPTHFESLYPSDSRYEELKALTTFIKEGKSVQLIALPGTGRTNLFGLLSYNRGVRLKLFGEHQKWFHFVSLDCSEIRKRPLLDAIKFIFLGLVDSLKERELDEEYETLRDILKDSLSFNDELVLFQGLKRAIDFLCITKELTVVLLFDRFEAYIPMLTPAFFTNLRVLRNHAKYRFSVVFAIPRPLEDMVETTLVADFYEFFADNLLYLPFTDRPSLEFRLSYIEKVSGKKLDTKIEEAILKETAGYMKLTRLAQEAVLQNNVILERSDNEAIESSSTQEILSRSLPLQDDKNILEQFLLEQKSIQTALSEIWQTLTPEEQKSLVILERSDSEAIESPSTQKILSRSLPLQDDKTKDYLEHIGLLKNEQLTIPLLTTYIAQQASQPVTATIHFDERNNEIMQGDLALSEKLTSSEFRLLRYLLQNTERVIEREEIINAVWHEAQSTAGVTDQALDQLIFRLRKKIESDPNAPTHLQTIKGRGFRFNT